MSDRALQDDLIRALADAPYRASPAWRQRGLADPERVERFARFLARHFYHERIVHFFKYSRALARLTGRRPEAVLTGRGFDALLPTLVLGGRDAARAVAALVVEHVGSAGEGGEGGAAAIPYLRDLLRYEEAMLVVEAGPRVWSDAPDHGERAGRGARDVPEKVAGTLLLDLAYDLPAVLPKLLRPWSELPQAPARPTKLLVARSPHGRVAVARSNQAVAALVELADGRRTLDQLATRTGLAREEIEDALRGLVELGAVRFSTGS